MRRNYFAVFYRCCVLSRRPLPLLLLLPADLTTVPSSEDSSVFWTLVYSVIYICVLAVQAPLSTSYHHLCYTEASCCFSSALHCRVSRTSTNLERHSLCHGAKVYHNSFHEKKRGYYNRAHTVMSRAKHANYYCSLHSKAYALHRY